MSLTLSAQERENITPIQDQLVYQMTALQLL